jgi:serine/threonine protein kinase
MRPDQVRTEVGRAVSDPRTTRSAGMLGDYRLGQRLDDGGTNEVYEATAPGSASKVVIKFLRRAVSAGAQATEACRQERARVAQLHHPNIAALLALGTTPDGVPYVVREHIEGPTLESYLAGRGPLFPLEVALLVKRIALPLAAAHAAGVFHGELRPSKIFLTQPAGFSGPFIKIVDFGLWHLTGDRQGPGALADNTRLSAPELISGQPQLNGAVDQYALAAIAFRMIAGVDLHPSDDVTAVLRSILESPPESLDLLCGDERVAAVIHRALARDPAHRFPGILAFARALERIATGSSAGTADSDSMLPAQAGVSERAAEHDEEDSVALLGRVDQQARPMNDQVGGVDGALPFAEMEGASVKMLPLESEVASWEEETPPPRIGHPRRRRTSSLARFTLAAMILSAGLAAAWWTGLTPLSELRPATLWQNVVVLSGR